MLAIPTGLSPSFLCVDRVDESTADRTSNNSGGEGGDVACGSSKLNPRELVGGFERLAIASLYGDADKRCAVARPQRTPNPHRAAVGIDRPAPSNCGPRALRNSSPVLSPLGSAVLDLVLALVAPMARQPGRRPARDGLALAPSGLVSALAISIPGALARWAPEGFQRNPTSDRTDGP
jgi:hypothetical protein